MESFLIFDIFVILFIFLSAVLSFSRGFSQETLSLFSWVSAFFISYFFSSLFIGYVDKIFSNILVSKIFSYVITFIISLFFLSFITNKFSSSVRKSSVGMIDRSLGFVFGLARGYILLALLLFVGNRFYAESIPKWFEKSKMNYLLMYGSAKIISFFDKNNYSVKLIEDKINKKSEKLFEKSIDSHLRREKKINPINNGYDKSDRENLDYLIENSEND